MALLSITNSNRVSVRQTSYFYSTGIFSETGKSITYDKLQIQIQSAHSFGRRQDIVGHRQTGQHSVDLNWSRGQTDRRKDGQTEKTDSLTDGFLPQHTVRWAVT